MLVRRLFTYALVGAVPVLPLWLVLARSYIVGTPGSDVPLLVFLAFFLAAALAVVGTLTWMRKGVRSTKSVSWLDVGVLGAWYLSIIAAGLVEHGTIAIPVVILAAAAFWSSLSQLFLETRRRVRSAIDNLGFSAVSAQHYTATRPGAPTRDAPLRGQVIRLEGATDTTGTD